MAHICDLPAEVLLLIFQYYIEIENQYNLLNRISRVCKNWKELCLSSILWTKYDGTLSYETMILFCKKGRLNYTKKLTINDTLKSEDAQLLFSKLKNLEVLNISSETNFVNASSVMADNCIKLREVGIEKEFQENSTTKSRARNESLNYQLLSPFFIQRGAGLTSLKFSGCVICNLRQVVRCIADCCPNLEELHLRNINCSSGMFATEYVQKRCPKLKILHLDHNVSISNYKHSAGFPNLEVFSYVDAKGYYITDRNFEYIVFNSPNLKFLNLTNCNISPETVFSIPACSLEYLYIPKSKLLNSKNIVGVFEKWYHSLKQVDVSHSTHMALNKALMNLVTSPTTSQLEYLNLSFSQVIATVVVKIVQSCTNLEELHLEGCRNLGRGMKGVYRGKSELSNICKKLETFISTNPTVNSPVMLE